MYAKENVGNEKKKKQIKNMKKKPNENKRQIKKRN